MARLHSESHQETGLLFGVLVGLLGVFAIVNSLILFTKSSYLSTGDMLLKSGPRKWLKKMESISFLYPSQFV